MNSLAHDIAWEAAFHIVEIFASLLREDEQSDAFAEVYPRVKAALERYEVRRERTQQRLRPGKN